MEDSSFSKVLDILKEKESFMISCHVNPDGDAIGSLLGMGFLLKKLGKKATLVTDASPPKSFSFLEGFSQITSQSEKKNLSGDVLIALDTATQERLGKSVLATRSAFPLVLNIDHHATNSLYGEVNLIDASASSTGEIVYSLYKALGLPLSPDFAGAIYTAISTDTASFCHSNTSARTHEIASDLLSVDFGLERVNHSLYRSHPYRRLDLLKLLLQEVERHQGNQVISWSLTLEMKKKMNFQKGDSEDLIDYIRSVEGILVAISFEELSKKCTKVSLRSNSDEADVSQVAKIFDGGGHARAAGICLDFSLEDSKKKVLDAFLNFLK